MRKAKARVFTARRYLLLFAVFCAFVLLFARAAQLQLLHADFYNEEGSNRQIRTVEIPANRGVITDRHGEALAISTPVFSIWAHPKTALENPQSISYAASVLKLNKQILIKKLKQRRSKQFVYVKRHVFPDTADALKEKNIHGFSIIREYRRFYPTGEMAAHVVGLTNIDDQGLEGVELAFDEWLHGSPGKKRVLKNGKGTVVGDIGLVTEPHHGKDLSLSIDKRIQYLAYRELKRTIARHSAKSGSVVVLSVDSGEVLAMANLPAFNPNDRSNAKIDSIRNRAITDVFEPGSTVKPFLIAAAIENGAYRVNSKINTAPGYFNVAGLLVSDHDNYGVIDMKTILSKSSNVGAVRVALKLSQEQVWSQYQSVGFGQLTGSGFPGERAGKFDSYTTWNKTQRATLAYGYGMSTTAMQLARAYSVIANDGILLPASFIVNDQVPAGHRVMSGRTAKAVRDMLKGVLSKEGTGSRASMQGYSAAGKTGTSRKSQSGGYSQDNYIALFAGMAPADNPEVVVVALIDQPVKEDGYYGGEVAAPLFSRVTEGALRLMNVAPTVIDEKKRGLLLTESRKP
ncbi:MAG: penicillin-binding protein 2 [Gammaproteobacteria bacterium]|nr:penicillin-binding protein 2 [Gammaproteobacteria bacterium]